MIFSVTTRCSTKSFLISNSISYHCTEFHHLNIGPPSPLMWRHVRTTQYKNKCKINSALFDLHDGICFSYTMWTWNSSDISSSCWAIFSTLNYTIERQSHSFSANNFLQIPFWQSRWNINRVKWPMWINYAFQVHSSLGPFIYTKTYNNDVRIKTLFLYVLSSVPHFSFHFTSFYNNNASVSDFCSH